MGLKKVLLTGGCTAPGIALALRMLMPNISLQLVLIHEVLAPDGREKLEEKIQEADQWIYMRCHELTDFASRFEGVPYPEIAFNAFHPDEVRAFANGNYLLSVTQDINSAIGLWSYTNGLSAKTAANLYKEEVFEELGYFEYWEASVNALQEKFAGTKLDFERVMNRIKQKMPFMLTTLHPNVYFISQLAKQIALQIGYAGDPDSDPIENCMYEMLSGIPSPYFPGVAERFGFRGALRWRVGDTLFSSPESYLEACFELYPLASEINCARLADGTYDLILRKHL